MRAWTLLLAAAALTANASASDAGAPAADSAVARHCLSRNPDRLKLTDEQRARIDAILRSQPDGPARRAAIVAVLTTTQRMLFQNMAGLGAC